MGLFSKVSEGVRGFVDGYEYNSHQTIAEQLQTLQDKAIEVQTDLVKSQAQDSRKGFLENPLNMADSMGYKDRPYSLSYEILRRMANRDAVISAIINTRVNQVSSFSRPARFDGSGIGFEIKLRDPEAVATDEEKKTIVAIEEFLENTGYDDSSGRDDFDTFIRKIVRDRLIYDQVTFEIVRDRKGRPAEFYAIDASTIRVATEEIDESIGWKEQTIRDSEEIKYVQIIDGQLRAFFSADEMAFAVSNPRTDIRVAPYGFSELEMLIHQITSHLWAEEYNSRYFSQGGTTKGIINMKPDQGNAIDPAQLASFKRQWQAQVSGVNGAWKTPVVSVPGLEYLNVNQSNREMEFEKWLNYLINIACSVYQIDPSEINFPNRGGATGSSGGGLGDGGIEDRLAHSRDKGLRPLLRFVEMMINKFIISKFDRKFVFSFVGIDSKSESEIADLHSKQVKTTKTVNDIRLSNGDEPLEFGDIILDSQYLEAMKLMKQVEQNEKMIAAGINPNNNPINNNSDSKEEAEEKQKDRKTKGEVEADDITDEPSDSDGVKKSERKFLRIDFD